MNDHRVCWRHSGGNNWSSEGAGKLEVVPVQIHSLARTVPKELAAEAYKEYAAQYGTGQSFERLHERGGFGLDELAILLYERIRRIEKEQRRG